jgi:protease-4
VAERRQISAAELNRYVDQFDQHLATYHGNTATAAVAAGLIDGLKDREAINSYLIEQVGAADEDGYYEAIGFETYLWLSQLNQAPALEQQVGLIVAAGNIVDGEQPAGTIGGDTVAALIRQARMDESVAALVLRVDSGGGSAFASEVIRRELLLLQQAGKPLVVSMGSMAASGGYWISASADEIWATPTTLTGSIGIFGAFPSFEKTLAKVGIHNDGVGTSKMAGALRADRALEPAAAKAVQLSIEHGYRQFLEVVAQGRGMSVEAVNEIAQGRVWSGEQALRLGLVDQLGGLEEAIAAAADKAELTSNDYLLIEIPRTPQEELLARMGLIMAPLQSNTLITQVQRLLKPVSQHLTFIAGMNDPRGVYAHCLSCIAP